MGFTPARTLVPLTLVVGLLTAAPAAPVHASHDGQARRCFGAKASIVGTAGSDVVIGSPGRDVIVGLGGDDEIFGRGGDDAICAGAGDDVADGGSGSDVVAGGGGADESSGGGGSDFVAEDHGVLALADVGTDAAADTYKGGPGDDLVADDAGSDALDGGPGNDTFFGLFSLDPLVVDLARGRVVSPVEVNTLAGIENAIGSMSADVIAGDDRPNVLMGIFGRDVVHGAGGPDLLISQVDGDVLSGGDDADAVFAAVNDRVIADLAAGTATAAGATDRLSGIEDFIGTPKDDVIAGSDGANRLYGGSGDDAVSGTEGDDVIFGDSPFAPWVDVGDWKMRFLPRGEDLLDGGAGTDVLDGGPLADVCKAGERLRHCESTGRERARPVAARGFGWRVPGSWRTWLARVLSAESASDVRVPRWTRAGLR